MASTRFLGAVISSAAIRATTAGKWKGIVVVNDGLVLLNGNAGTITVQPLLAATITEQGFILTRNCLATDTA